jgi:hypothetical protein
MTYDELKDEIKYEAEMNASTDFDTFIKSLLNQTAKAVVKKLNLIDFLVPGYQLTLVAATQLTPLPSDWCRLSGNRVYFQSGSDVNRRQLLTPLRLSKNVNISADARYFQITEGNINIVPYSQTLVGDKVVFDYYRKPDAFEDGDEDIPDSLEDVLRARTLYRLMIFKDSKRAAGYLQTYNDAFIDLAANGTIS